jgi:tetratricopeptide (TPR) repeat protein
MRRHFDYEATFDQAARLASERMVFEDADRVADLVEELLAYPESRRRQVAQAQTRFHSLKLCEVLGDRTREAWLNDPALAVEFGRLGVVIADLLSFNRYGTQIVEDIRAQAWSYLGNAFRVASDLRRAEKTLAVAAAHYRQSAQDIFTEAKILSFKASLRNSQGRYPEAAMLLDDVISLYRIGKDRHEEGRNLILKGMALGYDGQFQAAVELIRHGLSRIDLSAEPWMVVSARHNLIWYLNESGCHEEALQILEETRRLYRDLGHPLHLIRLRWVEGAIATNLGWIEEAESALKEAREAFLERGIGFDAALVSLDLATLLATQDRFGEVMGLAVEVFPIFVSRDAHPEALAALLLLTQAIEAESLILALLA